jgi:uncharacterized protein (DUF1800 family)
MTLYEPPDVAGWDAGQTWFSTGAMLSRMNFASQLTNNQKLSLLNAARPSGKTPEALLAYVLDELVTAPLDSTVTGELTNYLHATGAWTGSDALIQAKTAGLMHLVAGLPEYQLI